MWLRVILKINELIGREQEKYVFKVLIPTDGSELSDKALEAGVNFAKALGSSVVIATVIEPYSYSNLSEYRPESNCQ